ncbi:hypothetical protein JCM5353_006519 [Sporobolomyces roseus]
MFNARLLPLLLSLVGLVKAIDWFEVENLSGPKLGQAFNWETGGGWDNGGIPLYVNSVTARRNNLWQVLSNGQNIFRVSQTPNVDPYRMSTRVSSKKSYSGGGLFVFDVAHVPSGYGLWPALWMVGVPNWPHMGEGIAIYSFARNNVPADIVAGVPRNANWGTPTAYLSNSNCSIFDNFYGMKMVINTNLCGAWAGGVWKDDLWYAGAPGSPATKTGYADCNAYIRKGGGAPLRQAFWTINSIKIYNQTVEWTPVPVSTSPLPIPSLISS